MTGSESGWKAGPYSICCLRGKLTGHIETNTLHHVAPNSPSNSLVEDPHGREKLYHTLYSLGGRVGT